MGILKEGMQIKPSEKRKAKKKGKKRRKKC